MAAAVVVEFRRRATMTALAARVAGEARGQASVELVGLIPLAVVVTLALAQALAAGAARALAGHAAEAAALALVQGGDPRQAARDAVPGWSRKRMVVQVEGRRVIVRLTPPTLVPALAGRLTAQETADAGAQS
jgi:hypothetical protein